MRLRHMTFILFLFMAAHLRAGTESPNPTEGNPPLLGLNTQMHSEYIIDIDVDAQERYLLTCSPDRTGRLWDLGSGELLRVLRPSYANSADCVFIACALSNGGTLAVLGGATAGNRLLMFDTATGELIRSVPVSGKFVTDLKFSPDGRFLAVGFVQAPIVILNTQDWSVSATLGSFGGLTKLAFDSNGRLAALGLGNVLRLYGKDFSLLAETTFTEGTQPYSIALSHDGRKLVTCFLDHPQPAVYSLTDLKPLFQPDTSGLDLVPNAFTSACFSADDSRLIAAGNIHQATDAGEKWICRIWDGGGKGNFKDLAVAEYSIIDLEPLRDGGLVFGSGSPDWGRLDAKDRLILQRTGETFKYDNPGLLHASADGTEIGFTPNPGTPMTFRLDSRLLTSDKSSLPAFTDSITGLHVTDWDNSKTPKLNGEPLKYLYPNEDNLCVDVIPELDRVLLGGSWSVNCLDAKGTLLWRTVTVSQLMGVKAAPEGNLAVAALMDGTFRWYRLSDGVLLLTLFPHRDLKRWIIYTPSGYYDCSPQGEDLIGWHVNQGEDKEALFYPVAQFRDTYFRPDVIDLVLRTLDEGKALEQANLDAGITFSAKGIGEVLPPTVRITSPSHNSAFTSPDIKLSYTVTELNNEPLVSLKVLLDGRPFQVISDTKVLADKGVLSLILPRRNVRVGLIAENRFGKSDLEDVRLLWQGEPAPTDAAAKPKLYVLAVGVADYKLDGYDLKFAAKDARDFGDAVSSQKEGFYSSVSLELLTDAQASKESILAGLARLRDKCTPSDVAMIFLSGHGYNDNIGRFYYLPVGGDITQLRATSIAFRDFEDALAAIPGKVLMFVDACHSGGVYQGEKPPDVTRLVNTLSSDDVGVVIFTSGTPRQTSWESELWQNGAFTKALVEGLKGGADFIRNDRITLKELDLYISDRVPTLADAIGKVQTPTTIVPQSIPDFELGSVPR
jgi:WD40 repeat protein